MIEDTFFVYQSVVTADAVIKEGFSSFSALGTVEKEKGQKSIPFLPLQI